MKLAADLKRAPEGTGKFVRAAVEVTARNVKNGWRDRLKGSASVPGGPSTIGYDVSGHGIYEVSAEIGPELGRRQASIVGILETGDALHVPARGFGLAALQDNEGDFEHGLDEAIGDALKEAGL
jgi:hypothetical protein